MRVTTWAEYGLIVSVNLARRAGQGPAGRGGPVAARELAEQEKLPHDYVEQILLRLRRAGLVDSVRGAKGGYHLARPPQDISVKDVIEASEHVTFEVLCDPGIRLIEVDVDTTAYDSGHIAGAVGWNWQSQLNDPVRRDIPDKQAFAKLLSAAGVTPQTTVILYGDNNNWFAAFAFWLLQLYGHAGAKLMNGGRAKWVADGRPLVTDRPTVRPSNYPVPKKVNAAIRAKRPDVEKALKAKKITLVDVRSKPEFVGEIIAPPGMTETAQRAGHIPGAKNI